MSFLLITSVVTTIKNCICYPSSLKHNSNRCTSLQLSGATEVALLLTRPNFNTGKSYNYKGLPFVNWRAGIRLWSLVSVCWFSAGTGPVQGTVMSGVKVSSLLKGWMECWTGHRTKHLNDLYFLKCVISTHNLLKPEWIPSRKTTIHRKSSIFSNICHHKRQYFELLVLKSNVGIRPLTYICAQRSAVECRHLISCARSSKYCRFKVINVGKDGTFPTMDSFRFVEIASGNGAFQEI